MNRTVITRRALAAGVAAVAAMALAACGDDPADDTGSSEEASFNDADVEFAQMMIVHHEQAVEMSAMAADRAQDPEVLELADQIEAAQAPEIETMTGWLEAWGEPVEMSEHSGHGGTMPGMIDEEHMSMMEEASGVEFDTHFAESMIAHHEGAIEMSETEIADGENPDAIALAEAIIDAQQAEITQMEAILERL
ncbi:DUF305 domain-containing protein [Glycomyces buryatensis]|uniref:DUF305 domain-containing protein n=1 Tax=Glycomyces buryatensis TaxID=2570927 RepID=A0A4S8PR55_9ACTN|nr:DUF305 domain-containing protein [Glycomyces buryatensis]THV33648.1 DUF305 domain-containing protein [Glycomyces buryatensis]